MRVNRSPAILIVAALSILGCSQCRPTTQITPDYDCEPLAYFPE